MLDGISLDQLRTFISAADEGSFSAAGRKLNRVQSAVSDWVGSLEAQLGVQLFDRSGRYPKLTPEGVLLLADARNVVTGVDTLKARAKLMSAGLEPELSVVVDVLFPLAPITNAAKAFKLQFPHTPLRLYVEGLGAVLMPVMDGRCSLAIAGSLPLIPSTFTAEPIGAIAMVMVAAPDHPLAAILGTIPKHELARHVQLVLTDRSALSAGREFGVMSPNTWRLADLFAKREFLINGLGFGSMPEHSVADELATGRLVVLDPEGFQASETVLPMSAVYTASTPPGPAGRWFIDRIKLRCVEASGEAALAEPSNAFAERRHKPRSPPEREQAPVPERPSAGAPSRQTMAKPGLIR